jgi:mono/diheme cytochrome c family protein
MIHFRLTLSTICIVLLTLTTTSAIFSIWALSGFVNVAANQADNVWLAWVLHATFQRSLERQSAAIVVPDDLATSDNVRSGAHLYARHCVYCHGAPGVPLDPIGAGISPRAPALFDASRRNRLQSSFWVIKHGVRMTAMPSFGNSLTNSQLWQLAEFLYTERGIDRNRYRSLSESRANLTPTTPCCGSK